MVSHQPGGEEGEELPWCEAACCSEDAGERERERERDERAEFGERGKVPEMPSQS